MRILITGASGLLGLNVALELASKHEVVGVAGRTPLRAETFTALQADLLEADAIPRLLEQTRPDWVIHCAALANLEECEANPELARRINSEIPGILAEACRKGGARLLHVSTDAVFDGQKGNYSEEDTPNPRNVYAQTKLGGERAVARANASAADLSSALSTGPEALIARVNLFGFSPTGSRSLAEFFLYNLMAGKPAQGFTDVFFCPVLVNEIAWIFEAMLARGLGGLYHVFSAESLSKYVFGVRIAERFGLDAGLIAPVSVSDGGLVAARSPKLTMNTHKLSTALGHPLSGLSPMIDRFYALYQQGYPQRVRGVVRRD